jgi:hypothetical protein
MTIQSVYTFFATLEYIYAASVFMEQKYIFVSECDYIMLSTSCIHNNLIIYDCQIVFCETSGLQEGRNSYERIKPLSDTQLSNLPCFHTNTQQHLYYSFIIYYFFMTHCVKRVHCHHGMAHPRVANSGDDLQI